MALARLNDLKTRLGLSGTVEDARLADALAEATAMIEQYCQRTMQYVAADRTEDFDGGGEVLHLHAWPVFSVTSVKVALDYDFAGATALVASEEYLLHAARGRIVRLPQGSAWECGERIIRVVYRGGYEDPDAPLGIGVTATPVNVQKACLLQAVYCYTRRREPGYKPADQGAGGIGFGFSPDMEIVAAARQLLVGERRILA